MAYISPSSSGKKALNQELNLVPFIDLLSTLVLFLLVTVVWLKVSTIPVAVNGKASDTAASTPNPGVPKRLDIHLTTGSIHLRSHSPEIEVPPTIANQNGMPDFAELRKILAPLSNRLETAAVSAEDGVAYGKVITTIDVAKASGLASVGLTPE